MGWERAEDQTLVYIVHRANWNRSHVTSDGAEGERSSMIFGTGKTGVFFFRGRGGVGEGIAFGFFCLFVFVLLN